MVVSLAGGLVALPALAHKTEVSGDVAGIWHLEPNHSPKAGEPAQVWVALTRQGGKVIPLEQCDCRLAVFKANENEDAPVLQPELEPITAESFQGIPGAKVTFPEVGEYRLVLTGRPEGEGTFTPFELSYTTVVAAGRDRTNDDVAGAVSPEPAAFPGEPSSPGEFEASATETENTVTQPEGSGTEPDADSSLDSSPLAIRWLAGGVAIALIALAAGALRIRARQLDS